MNRFRQSTIFLAEDNPDDVEITRRAIKQLRMVCDLVVARDGEEAICMLCEMRLPPDFAMLDINLPRLDGVQVLSAIRANKRFAHLPVLMLSASAREEDIQRSYALGANSYIQKPVVYDKFIESLDIITKYWLEVACLRSAAPGGTK